jgi:hypothetical protein
MASEARQLVVITAAAVRQFAPGTLKNCSTHAIELRSSTWQSAAKVSSRERQPAEQSTLLPPGTGQAP